MIGHEEAIAPPNDMERFAPRSCPAVRAPSLFLEDGHPIHDLFGPGFSLLRFADIDTGPIEVAATQCGFSLDVTDLREAHARDVISSWCGQIST